MWEEILMSRRGFGIENWCIVGDFNAVRDAVERKGIRQVIGDAPCPEMIEFDSFLNDLNLVDYAIVGRQFTWFHPNGVSMSRLDRVLLSHEWYEGWPNANVRVLSRDVSDHCPLVLTYEALSWGPKPFRFNNAWLQDASFQDMIRRLWEAQSVTGWMIFVLKERLKGMKITIKEWEKETIGDPRAKKNEMISDILALDTKSEVAGLTPNEVVLRKTKFDQLWSLLKRIDASIFHKSRSKWLKLGDANSAFFHSRMKGRRRINGVTALRTVEGWVKGPMQVRRATVDFFKAHFACEDWV
ncbi:hypothetical protein P8452_13705 [Trifolium repens]|nr:hypothetical protein P8452_13705 [Trifolium repens]